MLNFVNMVCGYNLYYNDLCLFIVEANNINEIKLLYFPNFTNLYIYE